MQLVNAVTEVRYFGPNAADFKTKSASGGGTNNLGGYWTSDGRLVTFWD